MAHLNRTGLVTDPCGAPIVSEKCVRFDIDLRLPKNRYGPFEECQGTKSQSEIAITHTL